MYQRCFRFYASKENKLGRICLLFLILFCFSPEFYSCPFVMSKTGATCFPLGSFYFFMFIMQHTSISIRVIWEICCELIKITNEITNHCSSYVEGKNTLNGCFVVESSDVSGRNLFCGTWKFCGILKIISKYVVLLTWMFSLLSYQACHLNLIASVTCQICEIYSPRHHGGEGLESPIQHLV